MWTGFIFRNVREKEKETHRNKGGMLCYEVMLKPAAADVTLSRQQKRIQGSICCSTEGCYMGV